MSFEFDVVLKISHDRYMKGEFDLGKEFEVAINGVSQTATVHTITSRPEDGTDYRIGGYFVEQALFKGVNWEEIPEGYDWAAMDEDGRWYAFDYEPEAYEHPEDGGYWAYPNNALEKAMEPGAGGDAVRIQLPRYVLDWRNAKFKRPAHD